MNDSAPMLELRHVYCARDGAAVRDVSLALAMGSSTVLLGDAGAALLLRLASLQVRPDAGTLLFDMRPTNELDDETFALMRSRSVSMVYSASHLLPGLSAVENVAVRLFKVRAVETAEAAERTHAILEFVGVSGDCAADVVTLSRADQQRVALARALVTGPLVLVLHRAEEALGAEDAAAFRDTVQRACTQFHVTAIALPSGAVAPTPAQRVFVVEDGNVHDPRASVEK